MTIRYDDQRRILRLSVRDLVESVQLHGHLNMEGVQTPLARMALGRWIHEQYQSEQERLNPNFARESTLKLQVHLLGWTIHLMGRVDGMVEEKGRKIVEEVKSTAMDSYRLQATSKSDWTQYVHQVETYLWILNETGFSSVSGRLILISVLDGARHVLGVDLGFGEVDVRIRGQLTRLVETRESRIRWLGQRRVHTPNPPVSTWRPGQETIIESVTESLRVQEPVLVEAPTGLGKTAPIFLSALTHGYHRDQQIFWATAKTTQQAVVQKTALAFGEVGRPVRCVTLVAKEKACLNDTVSCRPDHCPYALDYYGKLNRENVLETAWEQSNLDREALRALGERHEVCPYQLGMDLSETADVVVGDYNYAFDPERSVLFAKEPRDWLVVVDEAHQLAERGRAYGSPVIMASAPLRAAAHLESIDGHRFGPFIQLAKDITDAILDAGRLVESPLRDGLAVVDLSSQIWRDLSDRIDELSLDYVRVRSQVPTVQPGERDPWVDVARSTLRFCRILDAMGSETVAMVDLSPGRQSLKLVCLDPSTHLQARMTLFGGWVACSATLSPSNYYMDMFGLDPIRSRTLSLPAFFPAERRRIIVASRVSTMFKDRKEHAQRTADLVRECVDATPGNVAVYFPSFAMLDDITSRWTDLGESLMVQYPNMSETARVDWLDRICEGGPQKVLAAVLGGIFAEGVDLPSGTLSAVIIAGPALPPVGLERDLLQTCYQERYGAGFQYASLIPGMTKVIQAAGRLLRSPEDKGVIVLIGRRFLWRDYVSLLPDWWHVERPDEPVEAIKSFWDSVSEF